MLTVWHTENYYLFNIRPVSCHSTFHRRVALLQTSGVYSLHLMSTISSFQITSLKKQLRNKSALLGDGVSRAFLRALVQLIGGYRDALRFQPGEKVTFDQEKFIETRPLSLQPFLREMLNLQIFRQVSVFNNLLLLTKRDYFCWH